MKTRNGFISNSSTTSFMIVVKKPVACPHCSQTPVDFLKALEIRMAAKKDFYEYDSNITVKEFINNLKEEIKEMEKDRKVAINERKIWEELSNDDRLIDGISKLENALLELDRSEENKLSFFRHHRWTQSTRNPKDVFKSMVYYLNTKPLDDRIQESKEILKKLETVDKEGILFTIKIDNYFDDIQDNIKLLINSGQAELIKETRT